jgi:serine protease Do
MNGGEIHVRRWVATAVVTAALVGGAFLASGLRHWTGRETVGAAGSGLPVSVEHNAVPVPLSSLSNGFASVLKPVLPAVVNIHSSKVVKQRQETMPFFNDPFFQQFFGNQGQESEPQREREESLGSGVIITADGTILTNNHVVEGATDIKVDLADKREFTAKVVGTDAKSDIAVLKIDANSLPTLKLGDSSQLQVGDIVLAVGDPYGVGETATMGIVSATGRSMNGEIENYEDFIQTDAPINPGNSGGALVDLHGDLIGINTAILSGNGEGIGAEGGNEGIGFAIPINMAHAVMDQLVSHGKVLRGFLGLLPQDVTPSIARQFGLNQPGGALVAEVEPDKPAAKAGIKQGDVILKVNGQTVGSANDLRLRISESAPGSVAKLEVSRDGKVQDIDVTLGQVQDEEANNQSGNQGGESSSAGLKGVQVQSLSSSLSQRMNLPSSVHGVVITSVDPDSAAAAAGLDRGCIIEEVNRRPVTNVQNYEQAIAAAGNQPVLLLVYLPGQNGSEGGPQYVVVQPQQ